MQIAWREAQALTDHRVFEEHGYWSHCQRRAKTPDAPCTRSSTQIAARFVPVAAQVQRSMPPHERRSPIMQLRLRSLAKLLESRHRRVAPGVDTVTHEPRSRRHRDRVHAARRDRESFGRRHAHVLHLHQKRPSLPRHLGTVGLSVSLKNLESLHRFLGN